MTSSSCSVTILRHDLTSPLTYSTSELTRGTSVVFGCTGVYRTLAKSLPSGHPQLPGTLYPSSCEDFKASILSTGLSCGEHVYVHCWGAPPSPRKDDDIHGRHPTMLTISIRTADLLARFWSLSCRKWGLSDSASCFRRTRIQNPAHHPLAFLCVYRVATHSRQTLVLQTIPGESRITLGTACQNQQPLTG